MEKKKLVLTGIDGYSANEVFEICEGESKVIGRSRSCDFSLRKLKAWMEASEEERESAEQFKTVSRRHLKVEVCREGEDIVIKLTDLSRNGTFVDEDKIGPLFEIKDWDTEHYCRLGEREKFKLSLAEDTGEPPSDSQIADADDGQGDDDDDVEGGTRREEKPAEETAKKEKGEEEAAAEESGEALEEESEEKSEEE